MPKDYTGLKGGRLTLIRASNRRTKQRQILWEAVCECGKNIIVRPTQVINGNTSSCGCRSDEVRRAQQHARRYDPIISSARWLWHSAYKDGCDFDTFYRLSQLPCDYCGVLPYRTFNVGISLLGRGYPVSDLQLRNGNFTYNGLDRVDSSIGHTSDNVVPCCYPCNLMKSDMGKEVFLTHIQSIYRHSLLVGRFSDI
jgi:hypothetical protein